MHRDLRLRNREVIMFLLPFVTLLWIVGWILYCAGAQREGHRRAIVAAKDDGVEVAFAVSEKNVEIDGQVWV